MLRLIALLSVVVIVAMVGYAEAGGHGGHHGGSGAGGGGHGGHGGWGGWGKKYHGWANVNAWSNPGAYNFGLQENGNGYNKYVWQGAEFKGHHGGQHGWSG